MNFGLIASRDGATDQDDQEPGGDLQSSLEIDMIAM